MKVYITFWKWLLIVHRNIEAYEVHGGQKQNATVLEMNLTSLPVALCTGMVCKRRPK